MKFFDQGTRHRVNVRGEFRGYPTYENNNNAKEMFFSKIQKFP